MRYSRGDNKRPAEEDKKGQRAGRSEFNGRKHSKILTKDPKLYKLGSYMCDRYFKTNTSSRTFKTNVLNRRYMFQITATQKHVISIFNFHENDTCLNASFLFINFPFLDRKKLKRLIHMILVIESVPNKIN